MRPTMHRLSINAVRSEALFVSALQRSDHPGPAQIREAIACAVREFGSRGCAARVAQEFGDHPETAVARMRWTRQVVDEVFGASRPDASVASPSTARQSSSDGRDRNDRVGRPRAAARQRRTAAALA